jgi:hypothetical protein
LKLTGPHLAQPGASPETNSILLSFNAMGFYAQTPAVEWLPLTSNEWIERKFRLQRGKKGGIDQS